VQLSAVSCFAWFLRFFVLVLVLVLVLGIELLAAFLRLPAV
jgi:hypothetical protein